jgi:hypothetical protein
MARKRVNWKRIQLGIASFVAAPRRGSKDEIAALGTAADPEVPRRLGKSAAAVQKKRQQLGIPPAVLCWTDDEIAVLGTASESTVAAVTGRPVDRRRGMATKTSRNPRVSRGPVNTEQSVLDQNRRDDRP